MSDEPMSLCERLRNPAYEGDVHTISLSAKLNIERTLNDMREAATLIETLERALTLRNEEVKTALSWLDGDTDEPSLPPKVKLSLECLARYLEDLLAPEMHRAFRQTWAILWPERE